MKLYLSVKGSAISLFILLMGSVKAQDIKPVMIGQRVPSIKIKNIINSETGELDLSELAGKVVVIDFWEAWCSGCVKALPKLDSMKKKFGDKLVIITVTATSGTANQIKSDLKSRAITRNFSLPVVVRDTILVRYFPHKILSHVVWIDSQQVVRAITGTDYINSENIKHY